MPESSSKYSAMVRCISLERSEKDMVGIASRLELCPGQGGHDIIYRVFGAVTHAQHSYPFPRVISCVLT